MNWQRILKQEQEKDYFKNIINFLIEDGKKHKIYPDHKDIFNAFKYCPLEHTKAVIIGQDVYHQPGQAHGLSFSVPVGVKPPPSLQNIFKELKSDLDINPPNHGCLINWAKHGVLLLNSSLTVREGQPGSHMEIWRPFTDKIISILNEQNRFIVYILWGSFAKQKAKLITNNKTYLLYGTHPSPLGANQGGFFGGKYFSKTNEFLIKNNIEPINWKIENG